MALLALVLRASPHHTRGRFVLMSLGLFGAALFYGDSAITPAMSVLSALEGLEVVEPDLKRVVLPIAIGVLIGLFVVQRKGTSVVGKLFGPIIVLWFIVLAISGIHEIGLNPAIFAGSMALMASLKFPELRLKTAGGDAGRPLGAIMRQPIFIVSSIFLL